MKYKSIIWISVFLILINLGYAQVSFYDDVHEGFKFDDDGFTGIKYGYTATNSGTTNVEGINGTQGKNMTTGQNYFYTETALGDDWAAENKSWSLSLWFKLELLSANAGMFVFQDMDQADVFSRFVNSNEVSSHVAGTYTTAYGMTDTSNWHHYVMTYDGSNIRIYHDGALKSTNAETDEAPISGTHYFGCYNGAFICMEGLMDEVLFINKTLNLTEVQELKEAGSEWNDTALGPQNFTITAEDDQGNSISVFNASIDGVDYSTSIGSIQTQLLDNATINYDINVTTLYHYKKTYTNYNITSNLIANFTPYTEVHVYNGWNYSSVEDFIVTFNSTNYSAVAGIAYLDYNGTNIDYNVSHENYINQSFFVNLTVDQNHSLYQTILNTNLSEKITNNTINSFTIETNYANYSTTTGNITLYPNFDSFVWNFSATGYVNRDYAISVTEQNSNYTFTDMYSSVVNISAIDKLNNEITDFTINITYEDLNYSEIITTTTGNATFNLLNDTTYNISIDAPGYQLVNNQSLTVDSPTFHYNFSLYTENSILFTFLNETLGNLINDRNVSIEIIGDVMSVNNTTENGTLFVDLLWPAEYIIRYSAEGFNEKFYYFTVLNRSFTELDLYLLENGSSTQITATVRDEINNLVEGARIKVMKYDLGTNSYILEEMADTNWEGIAKLNLELGTEFYYFIIEYAGETKEITEPSYIYSTSLPFQILIDEPVGEFFYNVQDVDHTLGYDNSSNTFRFVYNDPNSLITQSCLEVYNRKIDSLTLVNSSCQSATSGTINIDVAEINGTTYLAKAYVYLDGKKTFLSEYLHSFLSADTLGKLGIYLLWMLTILFACVGIWSVPVACILAPIPWIFGVLFGLVAIEMWVAITAQIMGLIVAVIVSKYS